MVLFQIFINAITILDEQESIASGLYIGLEVLSDAEIIFVKLREECFGGDFIILS